jgi:hypothetical protein
LSIRPRITLSAAAQARLARMRKWDEFLQFARRHQPPRWIFRGQRQHWPLKPSAGRNDNHDPSRELQLFNEFRRLARPMVDRSRVSDDWDWLFVAQHHGLPTRLLDWTTNPLIAAYFACQASPKGKRDGEVIAVEIASVGTLTADEISGGPFALSETKFAYPSAVAPRISSQRGLFSVHAQPSKNWILRNKTVRFSIAAEDKATFRENLFGLGIDSAMVMADLDGLAAHLCWRFESGRPI